MLNRTNTDTEKYESLFAEIAGNAEKILGLPEDLEISVSFVRSRTMRVINRDYRGIDRPTDVISFAAREEAGYIDEEMQDLGDLFINIDYARRQAREYGHSYDREICFLFTHGLLHCLGYDHMTAEEEKEMFEMQDRILEPVMPRVQEDMYEA